MKPRCFASVLVLGSEAMNRNGNTKWRVLAILLALSPFLAGWATTPARGEEQLRLVVIDTQRIYRDAAAVKGLQKYIDDQRSSYQDELRKKEESLRAADQALARQRTVLSAEAFAQKRRGLEEQIANLQREIQTRRKGLEKQFSEGMKTVQTVLVEVSQEIAQQRDAWLVIEKSAVVLVKPDLEITDEALKRLDKKLPKVDLSALQN